MMVYVIMITSFKFKLSNEKQVVLEWEWDTVSVHVLTCSYRDTTLW